MAAVHWGNPGLATRIRCESPVLSATVQDAESRVKNDPFLSAQLQSIRKSKHGLSDTKTSKFIDSTEFISLGCFCAATHSLSALGLKRFTYPFDWNRSPMDGIIHCLENNFADFLTYSYVQDQGEKGVLFASTQWGGSFWHHDLTKAKIKEDFARRIDRFRGLRDVPASKTRVFVRAVNSTQELHAALVLQSALRTILPDAKVLMLMLIDLQSTSCCMRASSIGDDIVFARIHEKLFAQCTMNWTMEQQSDAYSEVVALAVRFWAGHDDAAHKIQEVACLQEVFLACDPFDGGDPGTELFLPKKTAREKAPLRSGFLWKPSVGLCTAEVSEVAPPTPNREFRVTGERLQTPDLEFRLAGCGAPDKVEPTVAPPTPTQRHRVSGYGLKDWAEQYRQVGCTQDSADQAAPQSPTQQFQRAAHGTQDRAELAGVPTSNQGVVLAGCGTSDRLELQQTVAQSTPNLEFVQQKGEQIARLEKRSVSPAQHADDGETRALNSSLPSLPPRSRMKKCFRATQLRTCRGPRNDRMDTASLSLESSAPNIAAASKPRLRHRRSVERACAFELPSISTSQRCSSETATSVPHSLADPRSMTPDRCVVYFADTEQRGGVAESPVAVRVVAETRGSPRSEQSSTSSPVVSRGCHASTRRSIGERAGASQHMLKEIHEEHRPGAPHQVDSPRAPSRCTTRPSDDDLVPRTESPTVRMVADARSSPRSDQQHRSCAGTPVMPRVSHTISTGRSLGERPGLQQVLKDIHEEQAASPVSAALDSPRACARSLPRCPVDAVVDPRADSPMTVRVLAEPRGSPRPEQPFKSCAGSPVVPRVSFTVPSGRNTAEGSRALQLALKEIHDSQKSGARAVSPTLPVPFDSPRVPERHGHRSEEEVAAPSESPVTVRVVAEPRGTPRSEQAFHCVGPLVPRFSNTTHGRCAKDPPTQQASHRAWTPVGSRGLRTGLSSSERVRSCERDVASARLADTSESASPPRVLRQGTTMSQPPPPTTRSIPSTAQLRQPMGCRSPCVSSAHVSAISHSSHHCQSGHLLGSSA